MKKIIFIAAALFFISSADAGDYKRIFDGAAAAKYNDLSAAKTKVNNKQADRASLKGYTSAVNVPVDHNLVVFNNLKNALSKEIANWDGIEYSKMDRNMAAALKTSFENIKTDVNRDFRPDYKTIEKNRLEKKDPGPLPNCFLKIPCEEVKAVFDSQTCSDYNDEVARSRDFFHGQIKTLNSLIDAQLEAQKRFKK